MSKFVQTFNKLPKELFRSNYGAAIRLRAHVYRPYGAFDLLTKNGKAMPTILTPSEYEFPNGASLRSNTAKQHRLVRSMKGESSCIYSIPKGTEVPSDLILVHDFKDHYSLQPAKEMTVDELNESITTFLQDNATRLSKEEWMRMYPGPTERM